MSKRLIPFYFLFILLAGCNTANKDSRKPEVEAKAVVSKGQSGSMEYEEAHNKWSNSGITTYSMKVRYNAFSPLKGIWEIKVVDERLVYWEFRNQVNEEKWNNFAEQFMMSNLFKTAAVSSQDQSGALYITTAVFDEKLGYVKSIRRQANTNLDVKPPADRGFYLEIIEFQPEIL